MRQVFCTLFCTKQILNPIASSCIISVTLNILCSLYYLRPVPASFRTSSLLALQLTLGGNFKWNWGEIFSRNQQIRILCLPYSFTAPSCRCFKSNRKLEMCAISKIHKPKPGNTNIRSEMSQWNSLFGKLIHLSPKYVVSLVWNKAMFDWSFYIFLFRPFWKKRCW